MLAQTPLESGVTVKAVIALVEVDGVDQWFAGNMAPNCRTVLIGADAYGAAGTHDRLEAPRLGSVPGPEAALRTIGAASAPEPDADLPEGVKMTRSALTMTAQALPPHCEYINGRWYCW
jgi:hypothetical protein